MNNPTEKGISLQKFLFMLIIMLLAATSGCSPENEGSVPSDFVLIMDVGAVDDDLAQNVNIRTNTDGKGQYKRYNTSGVIRQDPDGMVIYRKEQIVDIGTFRLSDAELMQLWRTIKGNHFFELDEDYRMAIGHSYAFVKVDANGQSNRVFNIGMEVPEIKAIVEAVQSLLSTEVNVEYGEGFQPK